MGPLHCLLAIARLEFRNPKLDFVCSRSTIFFTFIYIVHIEVVNTIYWSPIGHDGPRSVGGSDWFRRKYEFTIKIHNTKCSTGSLISGRSVLFVRLFTDCNVIYMIYIVIYTIYMRMYNVEIEKLEINEPLPNDRRW